MGQEPGTLQGSTFTQKQERKGLGQVLGITPSPCSLGLGAVATVSQQEGPGATPKHRDVGGVNAQPSQAASPSAGSRKQGQGMVWAAAG